MAIKQKKFKKSELKLLKKEAAKIYNKFSDAYDEQVLRRTEWLRYYKYYRAYLEKTYAYRRARILPIAFSSIMSVLPRLIVGKPKIRYLLRKVPVHLEQFYKENKLDIPAEVYESTKQSVIELMNYIIGSQWKEMSGDSILSEALLYGLIYGTYIIMTSWNFKENRPEMEPIEPFEFFPNPNVNHPRKLDWAFRRSYKTAEFIKDMYKQEVYYIPLNQENIEELAEDNEIATLKAAQTNSTNSSKGIEVIEYYSKDVIVTFVNKQCVRYDKNPFEKFPFVVGYNYYSPGEFWGMSEIDQIEQFIADMTDVRAARLANIEVSSNNMWRVDPNKQVYMEDIINNPGQVIRAEQGAIEALRPQPISTASYQEEAVTKGDIRETTGISDYMRGSTPGAVESATAVAALNQTGNTRIAMRLTNLTQYCLVPLGKLFLAMNKKFLKPVTLRIKSSTPKGYEVVDVSPQLIKSISGKYDIVTIPSENSQVQKQELLQMLAIVLKDPEMATQVNKQELLLRLFKLYNVPTYNLVKAEQPQAQAVQPQMQGPQGQPTPQQLQQMQAQQQQQPQQAPTPEQLQRLQQLIAGGR